MEDSSIDVLHCSATDKMKTFSYVVSMNYCALNQLHFFSNLSFSGKLISIFLWVIVVVLLN